ncbi:hypothetical protein BC830DRAFT_1232055 [Chytriomyces sp. MP71]|nr:hypothetical protein BC830DRAFT_1232055 [Chytriomyces sp. MP71]
MKNNIFFENKGLHGGQSSSLLDQKTMDSDLPDALSKRVWIMGLLSSGLVGTILLLSALTWQVFVIEASSHSLMSSFNIGQSMMSIHDELVASCRTYHQSLPWIMNLFQDSLTATFELGCIN